MMDFSGGAYGGGKAGGAFDPIGFVMRPTVILRAVCWVSCNPDLVRHFLCSRVFHFDSSRTRKPEIDFLIVEHTLL